MKFPERVEYPMNSERTVFDLFCGTGGFSFGMESCGLGFSTRLGVDLLPLAAETFKMNHPKAIAISTDIRKLRRAEVLERTKLRRDQVDVIVGGPPCQGFSSIRPFRSAEDDDPRNSLFEEFAAFVNYFRPKVFVLENVVGLATYKSGSTIASMQQCFFEIGYDCDWKLLNAANFGVPQKRERLIMIGAQKGTRLVFPDPTHSFAGPTIGFRDRRRILAPLGNDLFGGADELQPSVTVMDAIGDLPSVAAGEAAHSYTRKPNTSYQKARRAGATALTMHDATGHSDRMLEIIRHSGPNISSIPKHLITSGFSSCYSRLAANEPAVTITVNFVHPASNRCIHPVQQRALTPREGARLQSFDDTFLFAGNRTHVVKQIGNAVPPLLGRAIGSAVAKMLN